jgi:hypothetical protein
MFRMATFVHPGQPQPPQVASKRPALEGVNLTSDGLLFASSSSSFSSSKARHGTGATSVLQGGDFDFEFRFP